MTLAALRSDATVKKTLTLSGPKAWTVPEVIELCENLADERAQVTQASILLIHPVDWSPVACILKDLRQLSRFITLGWSEEIH